VELNNGTTADFIVGLERDYPSTVSAIARTCGKLAPKNDDTAGICTLCER
jgi:cytoplasmic tRNA 2-thiolation protein 2